MKCPEQGNLERWKINEWLPWAEGEGRNVGNESKIVLTFFLSDKKCSKIHCVDGCTYL